MADAGPGPGKRGSISHRRRFVGRWSQSAARVDNTALSSAGALW